MTASPPRGWRLTLSGDALQLHLSGPWRAVDGLTPAAPAAALADVQRLEVIDDGVGPWDSALLVFLLAWIDAAGSKPVDLSAAPEGVAAALRLARATPARETPQPARRTLIHDLGAMILRAPHVASDQIRFWGDALLSIGRALVGRARWRGQDLATALSDCGPSAIGVVALIALLTGMILAFIGAVQLRRFGAQSLVADLVSLAMTREMAAVMTGIVMAGRTGAAFAAQLSSMQANEEVDALAVMGTRASDFLTLPRLLALTLATPLHYVYAVAVGLIGGGIVSDIMLDVDMRQYFDRTLASLRLTDAFVGMAKSAVFGLLIAAAGCRAGLAAQRSAAGVGRAATRAVVSGIVHVICADALFAVVMEAVRL